LGNSLLVQLHSRCEALPVAQGCRAISATYVVDRAKNGAIMLLAPADKPGRSLGPLEALARALSELPPGERCGHCFAQCT